jgi:hypothetical protein
MSSVSAPGNTEQARHVASMDIALAGLIAAGAVADVAWLHTTAGWLLGAAMLVCAAFLAAVGVWIRRHPGEWAARQHARSDATQARIRRHPRRWLIGMPIFAAADGVARMYGFGHHSAATIVPTAIGGAAIGLGVAMFATRRAKQRVA